MQYLRFVIKGTLANVVETRNMFEYATAGTSFGSADLDAMEDRIADMFTDITDLLAQNVNWYAVEFYTRAEGAWQPLAEHTISHTGSGAVAFAAYQTAMVVNAQTDGFKSHARKFIAGLSDDVPVNGRLGVTPLSNLAALAADWLLPVTIPLFNTWYPGVMGKGEVWHGFLSTTAEALLGTIRRRKPGYGI